MQRDRLRLVVVSRCTLPGDQKPRTGGQVAATVLFMLVGLSLAGCGMMGRDGNTVATAAMGTVHAVQTAEVLTPSAVSSPSQTPTRTDTPTPALTSTSTPTPTETPPVVRVSLATNCRSGPGDSFSVLGVLEPGESAQVQSRSTLPEYLYVVNPDQPDENCWLWAGEATVEGDLENLTELTPVPSPRPSVGFQLYFWGFGTCGDQRFVILIVQNTGRQRLMSSNLYVYNSSADKTLHGPAFERHPFAESSKACPPGHGNVLDPGGGAYIIIPIRSASSGDLAYADVRLCTEDFVGGDCETNTIFFRMR